MALIAALFLALDLLDTHDSTPAEAACCPVF
jgi:hypothetical protein